MNEPERGETYGLLTTSSRAERQLSLWRPTSHGSFPSKKLKPAASCWAKNYSSRETGLSWGLPKFQCVWRLTVGSCMESLRKAMDMLPAYQGDCYNAQFKTGALS